MLFTYTYIEARMLLMVLLIPQEEKFNTCIVQFKLRKPVFKFCHPQKWTTLYIS